ncbi:hypothetical protein FE257_002489 [Aspergillus nanangensis]|uniref:Uncharacterized protein n=1 Tax=Aspergillus nanangensis TaxID=2582783 RepID=A0AAD4CUM8_ASPNN|nr:hypothetical protein FE257_002489 [Aspergillus nanangensis]
MKPTLLLIGALTLLQQVSALPAEADPIPQEDLDIEGHPPPGPFCFPIRSRNSGDLDSVNPNAANAPPEAVPGIVPPLALVEIPSHAPIQAPVSKPPWRTISSKG